MQNIKVAYVSSENSVTTSANRRPDPYIHDDEFLPLVETFKKKGAYIQEVDWRLFDYVHQDFDLLLMRSVSDYTRHTEQFIQFLSKIEYKYLIGNKIPVIKQNMQKTYLRDLANKGYQVIKSLFLEKETKIKYIFDILETDDIIIKPIVGEGGYGQKRCKKSNTDPNFIVPVTHFVQPMMDSITKAGEFSLVFIRGKFSHAAHKSCNTGDYRTQPMHGGIERSYEPSNYEIGFAKTFVSSFLEEPLICRIDFIHDGNNLLLMEIEAIDAYLYPNFCPDFGERIYSACYEYIKDNCIRL